MKRRTNIALKEHFNSLLLTSKADGANLITNTSAIASISAIFLGSGLYGSTIGIWRSPLQAFYAGLKFPLVILFTVAATSLINAMLSQILGANLSFRNGLRGILASYAITSIILSSLSPILFFVALNAPPLPSVDMEASYNIVRLCHVGAISLAGCIGTLRLLQCLRQFAGSRAIAAKILATWLFFNLFVGAQFSWILRPFIGSPLMTVEFLREYPLKGNFYEEVWKSASYLSDQQVKQTKR